MAQYNYNKESPKPKWTEPSWINCLSGDEYNDVCNHLNAKLQQSASSNAPVIIKESNTKNQRKQEVISIQINRLNRYYLKQPLNVVVEPDEDLFLARCPDLPLYGCSEDVVEALEMLKREIESLWKDLKEEKNLDEEWSSIKEMLDKVISYEE